MKKILSLGKKFVPGCTFLLVLIALNAFAPAHNSPVKSNLNTHTDQDEIITGTVSDLGGPIPGVLITVKNTNISAVTNENGHYTISALPGDTLVFSYKGYETLEIVVSSRLVINVEMHEVIALGEAVINAGYYTVKDRERTGSIYRITAEEIEQQPVNNILDALQGRVPGLDIIPTTGLAGGGYTVRIRGQNSIAAGNEPLYIIDGMPYDIGSMASFNLAVGILPSANISPLNTIDPNSIESIEILKDADATAIYGSKGANGVILINTKKGRYGKTEISVEASNTMISVTRFMNLLNTQQYIDMRKLAFESDGITSYPTTAYDINGTWDQNRYTDWQKELAGGTAFNQNMRISVSGGGQQTRFNLGGAFMKETTVFPGNFNYKKASVFASLLHNSKNELFNAQFSFQYGIDSNNLPSTDIYGTSLTLAPNAPSLYDDSGNLNWEDSTWNNPLAPLFGKYSNNSKNLIANGVLSYKIMSGISFKTNLGYTSSDLEESQLRPHTIYNPAYGLTSQDSNSFHNNGFRNSWQIEPQFDGYYKHGKIKVNLTIGATFQQQSHRQLEIMAFGYPDDVFIGNLSAANRLIIAEELENEYKYIAAFARLNYNYGNKYLINLTGRRDGSSRFGSGNRFANFGAIGIAWIFSEENLLSNIPWLSFGKLRASIGITGNDQIGDYQYLKTYSVSNAFYDGNIGLTPTRLLNPDYGWEKNRKTEIAMETRLFKERVNFEISFYENRSDNQLLPMPLPGTTGFSYLNSNLNAVVKNFGWEFNIKTVNINNSYLKWELLFNLSIPKNKLISFEGLEDSPYANRFAIGHSLNIYKLFHYTGINQQTGVFEFEDYNGDGIISSPFDNQFIVDFAPKILAGFSNSVRFKEWTFDINLQYVKRKGFNEYNYFGHAGTFSNQPSGTLNNWSVNSQNPGYQILTSGNNYEAFVAHSRFSSSSGVVSDASFVRLKTASISYRVKLGNTNCLLYLQGQNLLTFTRFKGGDPERNLNYLPTFKRIQLGTKINF